MIVLTFDQDITNANVTPSSTKLDHYTIFGNRMFLYLKDVSNASCVTISLSGVTGNNLLQILFLLGDVNSNRVVDSVDLGGVRGKFTASADASLARYDVDRNGLIDFDDLNLVRSKFGTQASECAQ